LFDWILFDWVRSAFFFFCNEERSHVKQQYPSHTVGDIAKELGKRWEVCQEKPRFEAMAVKDKQRYEQVGHPRRALLLLQSVQYIL